jgi:subtilisin family serine protease
MKANFFLILTVCLIIAAYGKFSPHWLVKIKSNSDAAAPSSLAGLINEGLVGNLKNVYRFHGHQDDDREHSDITQQLMENEFVEYAEQEKFQNHILKTFTLPNDPYWNKQWVLYNLSTPDRDINVVPVWIQNITGQGTTVLVVDNGIQVDHPDLKDNIDLSLCHSVITGSSDISPIPSLPTYNHGTSCAGIIAMIHDNGVCGTGVAYNTRLGGYQLDFANKLPSHEIDAFSFEDQIIQVSSNSWGPSDNGYTVDGPTVMSTNALETGATEGRGGLGTIYTFAAGNGGTCDDSCAADGYASSIYTIAIGSINRDGTPPSYDEKCSAKLAAAYSRSKDGLNVVTTFPDSKCITTFTGTSAAAPLASGVILLALEVNPNLSWRDIQYLFVYTSTYKNLQIEPDTNGAGLKYSSQFGFGAVNAEEFVNRARYWTPVGPSISLRPSVIDSSVTINAGDSPHEFEVQSNNVEYLEHVVLTTTFSMITDGRCYDESDYSEFNFFNEATGSCSNPIVPLPDIKRGNVQITLESPSGTESVLLPTRNFDFISCTGYTKWPFMSVHFWGERPNGTWRVIVEYEGETGGVEVTYMDLTFYALSEKPKNVVDKCDPACATPTGCSYGNSSIYCDECGEGYSRNVTTLECVRACAPGSCLIEGVCVFYNGTCPPSAVFQYLTVVIIVASILALVLIAVCICICICICCCCCFPAKKYSRLTFQETDEFGYVPYADSINPAVV